MQIQLDALNHRQLFEWLTNMNDNLVATTCQMFDACVFLVNHVNHATAYRV